MTARRLVAWSIVLLTGATLDAASDLRLVEAMKNRNREALRALLKEKIDVNAPQPDGATALHWAVYQDDLDVADLLIRAGANVNAANELGVTPLYLACDNGSAPVVGMLLKAGADPHATLPSGETALMTAARAGSVDAVKALISRGANVNAREKRDGQTALMWAASQNHAAVADALIAAGANVHARSDVYRKVVARSTTGGADGEGGAVTTMEQGGYSPLLFASRNGAIDSARLLLAAGANVNDTTPDGASALAIAAHSGQTAVGVLLLERGADPNAAQAGYAPLHLAVLRGDHELLRALLRHDADPNPRVTKGTVVGRQTKIFLIDGKFVGATPFFLAAKYADALAMRLLAAVGADPLLGLEDGSTPLMVSAGMHTDGMGRGGQDRRDREMDSAEVDIAYSQDPDLRSMMNSGIEAVKLAIALGADVNAANAKGDTALHSAAAHGFPSVIKWLVSQGARLDAKNTRGQTPLMAVQSRREAALSSEGRQIAAVAAALIRTLGGKP